MNCLESRRLLLAHTRALSAEHRRHVSACSGCARFARHVIRLERELEGAMRVPAPYAIAERMLRRVRRPAAHRYAATALAAGVAFAAGAVLVKVVEPPGFSRTVHAVGPTHPAVVAIAEVADHTRTTPGVEAITRDDLAADFRRLGLIVPAGEAHAQYAGQCHLDGGSECERIVLTTRDEQASVMLVPGYPAVDRVLVSDQRMVALMAPARDGAYIVVAKSAEAARRIEKLLVEG